MTEFSWRTRRDALERIEHEIFDLLIIGGGITGAGIALDAAARGLRTLLVEKRDFAAGTSSRTTKLIHGGLRYLEQFDFGLVREALVERAILTRTAPHLTEPWPFVIPIYADARRNYDHPLKMRAGLILYDLLSMGHGFERHRRLSREEALSLAPQLDPRGLKGAFLYYDGRTNDSRLVVEAIKAAHEQGAQIVNHASVRGFLKERGKDGRDRLAGARLRDEATGREIEAHARVVVNATGVWMEETIRFNEQVGALPRSVRPAKGIHLTIAAERLPVRSAWLIPSLTGHRFYFVVPWQGRVNIGTTDTDYQGDKDAPAANEAEVTEILNAINSYFPDARLEPADVITTWAGLRPLITDPRARNTSEVSRKEELIETPDGLISISGGKLTTYRQMAEHTVDLAARRLRERFDVSSPHSRTRETGLSGAGLARKAFADTAEQLSRSEHLPIETARHLIETYGSNHPQLVELLREDERLRRPLIEGLPHLAAEIVYAARCEMALTLTDALMRRTRLAMLAGEAARNAARPIAELMARELEWSPEETARQLAVFEEEYRREYQPH
ncbi:MAG: glycerol-3-phosphate dehydrogenase/oxidase [Blastocatellia bacterium]|nr:glycerol-3-phosphate dehydrogenase/oxidase [Blastocatellia bacterium]